MTFETLLVYLSIIAVAGYFQTVTGFGLGMIFIGGVTGFGITPVAVAAAVVSLLALVNCAVALPGRFDDIRGPMARAVIIGIVPAIVAGLMLLDYLSTSAEGMLRIALGTLIIYGGISIVRRSTRRTTCSAMPGFFISGVFAGLCGGLFGISGPPLIYQFYRQPLALVSIRNMLILCFAVTSSARVILVGLSGWLDGTTLALAAWAVPMIALTTYLGRRFPPPLSPELMRGVVFCVLVGIGSELIGSQLLSLWR